MIILKGKTKKGREKIKQWGDKWTIIRPEVLGRVAIASVKDNLDGTPKSFRWIELKGDPDFEVVS